MIRHAKLVSVFILHADQIGPSSHHPTSSFLDHYDDDRMLMEWASTTVEGGDEMRWVCSVEKIWANVSRPQNHPSSLMTGPEWEQPQEMDERLRVVPHSPEYIVYLVVVGQVFVTLFLRQTDVIG